MSRWFRFYDDSINDPKVLRMSPEMRWHWVAMLSIASKNDGRLPSVEDVALMLRTTVSQAQEIIDDLVARVLLDEARDGTLTPHNWRKRQYKSDVSTDRVKRFRKRARNVSETPPETEQIQSTEQKKDIRAVASATRSFDDFWKAYPRRDGANPRTPAKKKFDALVKSGVDPGEIISAASRYAAEMRAKGQERTPYVAQAMTWLGQQRHGDYGEPELEQPADAPGFYAAFSSPQLEAWDEYERSIGKRKPRDKAGGWRYETEWPPGHKQEAA